MKTYRFWYSHLLCCMFASALLLSSCGSDETPTVTPEPPATVVPPTKEIVAAATNTVAPTQVVEPTATTAAVQPESPLAASAASQPESPLAAMQPESPLASALESDGPIPLPTVSRNAMGGINPLDDFDLIVKLSKQNQAPKPKSGTASISGILFSTSEKRVIPGTVFYLTPAIKENGQIFAPSVFTGPNLDHGDVSGTSDELGQFMLTDIPPGDYFLAVWTVYDWLLITDQKQSDLAVMYTLKANEQRNLELIQLAWP